MAQLELIPENSVEIIQCAYTHLSAQYDGSDRCIVDYTYSFTYKSFCAFEKNSDNKIRYIKKDKPSNYKTTLRGFLFVDVTPNQHYFFLPEECLIIECNNGEFAVLDFLGQDCDETHYPKIINRMLSSLEANEFFRFEKFNKFYNQNFSIDDFCNKLASNKRILVKEIANNINSSLYTEKHYNSIFQDWLKYFLGVNLTCRQQYCAKILKEINIDLSNKKDFYVLQLGYYHNPALSDTYPLKENLNTQSDELEYKLNSAFEDVFSNFIKANIADPLSYFYEHHFTYLQNISKRNFFIPANNPNNTNWNSASYFVFSPIGKYFSITVESNGRYDNSDFLKHITLDNSIWNPKQRNVYNDIFTQSNIQKDDFLEKLQDYFFFVAFGYNETKQLIHKYALYNCEKKKELINQFDHQDIFKISEDDFLSRMRAIYKLLQEIKQLQKLDYQLEVEELNDYIIKNELDSDIVVI